MRDQKIEKRPHARGQMRSLADIDGMDVFGPAGVVVLQDGDEAACLKIGAHLELGQPRQPQAGHRHSPQRLAIADLRVALRRERGAATALGKGPGVFGTYVAEGQAVVAR